MANSHLKSINDAAGIFYVTYNPVLAKIFGKKEALLLGCLIYWIGKSDDDYWIYKASHEISRETGLSDGQITRAIKQLETTHYFKCELHGLPATRHFHIEYELLLNDLPSLITLHELDDQVERNKNIINGRTIYKRKQNNIKTKAKENALPNNSIGSIIANRLPP